jgi:hypothetical protein
MPNNVPALPINDTLPSCNTSNLMDEVELPENTIVAFADEPLGVLNIIYDDVTELKVTLLAVVNANPCPLENCKLLVIGHPLRAFDAVIAQLEVPRINAVGSMNKDPLSAISPLTSSTNPKVGTFLIPTLLPVTTIVLLPYAPNITRSSLYTSNIGRPEISFTLSKLPVATSDISNNAPFAPMNDSPPFCNTSSDILDVRLPENTIAALLLVLGERSII